MSENVLETIRATVQDFLAPEIRTHGVRLENIDKRLDEMRHSLEHRIDDTKDSLSHRIDDSKETLRAEIRASDARMDARMSVLDGRIGVLEGLIRSLIQQITVDTSLRERVAAIEARMPKQ